LANSRLVILDSCLCLDYSHQRTSVNSMIWDESFCV
jgi:hypothetical protein